MKPEFSEEQKFDILRKAYPDEAAKKLIEKGIKHGATPVMVGLALRMRKFNKGE